MNSEPRTKFTKNLTIRGQLNRVQIKTLHSCVSIICKSLNLGGKYLAFVSSRSVKMRGSSAFSVYILFEENVFIFKFLNDKIHSYVVFDTILHSIIQKLKNKQTFLQNIQTEEAEEPLILTEREETKTRYFAP